MTRWPSYARGRSKIKGKKNKTELAYENEVLKPPKKAVHIYPTEIQIQKAYMDWVKINRNSDWRFRLIYPVPNFGKRDRRKASDEGITKGIFDVSVDIQTPQFAGLRIEFKSESGKLTIEQLEMQDVYRRAGYLAVICRDAREAIALTQRYLASSNLR